MQSLGPLTVGLPAVGNEDYDLNGDGSINVADRNEWLSLAAVENGLPSPYKLGDANLDGFVEGEDFIEWNANAFTASLLWSKGDFTADGLVDGADYFVWNDNKFTSSLAAVLVPEPNLALLAWSGVAGLLAIRRKLKNEPVR